jgi:two-component system NtrC family response regulator
VQRLAKENGRGALHLSDGALAAIESHDWPGNVRELENCLKRAVVMADGNRITADDLGLYAGDANMEHLNLRHVRDEAERRAVVRVLARTNGNVARAADILGVSRPSLYDLMNRFGLKKES